MSSNQIFNNFSDQTFNKFIIDEDGYGVLGYSSRNRDAAALSDDGNRLIVGNQLYDNETGQDRGRARVYDFDGTTWNKVGQTIELETFKDTGQSVRISGDGSVIAVTSGRTLNNYRYGMVIMYYLDNNTWKQLGNYISHEPYGDMPVNYGPAVGSSLSLSYDGNRVIIGSPAFHSTDWIGDGIPQIGKSWGIWFKCRYMDSSRTRY